MSDLSQQIGKVIETRKEQLTVIKEHIQNVSNIQNAIADLKDSLVDLSNHPRVTEELKLSLENFKQYSNSLDREISDTFTLLENAKTRLSRETITIGCSGQARVGKSTLLKTIGSLPDSAIPTGKGIPVTAVRSRLRHSNEQEATLYLRDKRNFVNELIKPYHRELNLPPIHSFDDFKNFDYNQEGLRNDRNPELLNRLKNIHASKDSYEHYLTGQTLRVKDLKELRPWVAYPTQEEKENPNCPRLYLAVNNVDIQCSFLVGVEKLVLVDLPGLGEANIDAKEHHLQGLKDEVDLVLLILRPTEQTGFWKEEDRKALNLISEAIEGIARLKDFVIIVINKDNKEEELYGTLVNDIHEQLNDNKANSRYQVLTCDAINPDNVTSNLLIPALQHLITHLPLMDKEVIELAIDKWGQIKKNIKVELDKLQISLNNLSSGGGTPEGNVFSLAKELRQTFATKLVGVSQKFYSEMKVDEEEGFTQDNNFLNEIENKHELVDNWAKNGLGKTLDKWQEDARGRFYVDYNVDNFSNEEINRARTYITETYSKLDVYFHHRMEQLWKEISQVVRASTGNLLEDVEDGKPALEKFLSCLGDNAIGDPFPSLREAVEYLLKCGAENAIFQSHLLPKLINEIQKLAPEALNLSQISYTNPDAQKLVFDIISNKIIQTSYNVQKALKQEPFIAKILYSAAFKFEDTIVRSTDADGQFFQFASFYKNEIWTDRFKEIETNHAIVKRVDRELNNLQKLLNITLS